MMRIQKYLSQLGLASRREAEKWILDGRVSVNGQLSAELGRQIDPEKDQIAVDGKPLNDNRPPMVYWLFHKPDRYLCSHRPDDEKETIFDLPNLKNLSFRLLSVGRLDYRTEGLLLLSNDGDFVNLMTHPRYKVPRHYYVLINGKLSDAQLAAIRKGVPLEDGLTQNVEIHYAHGKNLGGSRGSWYIMTVYEGRNRLIRRIFEHFELKVIRLIRYGMGPLRLDENLKPGHYRQLSAQEIKTLKSLAGAAQQSGKSSNTKGTDLEVRNHR